MEAHKIASPLSRKATLVGVTVRTWTARKLDKRVTAKVNREHGASDDAGRYNKLLIKAQRLEKINALASQARKLHYSLTKPWADEGLRILPNVLHQKFADAFRVLKRKFETAADEFCADYPLFVEERKEALNGMFNQNDYPSPTEIRSKFELNVVPFPIPESDDFRSDVLDEDTLADLKRELAATSEAVLDGALKDTAKQITTVVGHMAKKLREYKDSDDRNFFTKTLVGNVRNLVELLPAFNLTNDPRLTALTERIKNELCVEEVKELRDNDVVREDVQKSAEDILRDVESLLG